MQTYVSEVKCQISGPLTKSQLQELRQEVALEQEDSKKENIK